MIRFPLEPLILWAEPYIPSATHPPFQGMGVCHTPTYTPFQVSEIMEKHFYKDLWHHIEAEDARWDHYRSALKHLPVILLPVLLLLPPVLDFHLPIYRLCQEGDGFKWSDCSFLNLTICKNLKILPICLQQLYHTTESRVVGFPSVQLQFISFAKQKLCSWNAPRSATVSDSLRSTVWHLILAGKSVIWLQKYF